MNSRTASHWWPDAAIPVKSDVATGLYLLRADDVPDEATALGYHPREIGRTRLASNDGERNTTDFVALDGV